MAKFGRLVPKGRQLSGAVLHSTCEPGELLQ